MSYFRILASVGFAATAISYGPGRIGFGLFVPELKSDFGMSASTVGFVSSLGFFGFFVALVVAQAMLIWRGPKMPVVTGLLSATCGMAIVAAASNTMTLALGVFLASASAGFAWTPFNDAVNRKVRSAEHANALSLISTGTSFGIILAAAAAFTAQSIDLSWRVCWAAFSLAAAFAVLANWAGLKTVEPSKSGISTNDKRQLLNRFALPLYSVAFVLGVTSAIYIAFGSHHVQEQGPLTGLPAGSGAAALFLAYGVFGLAGVVTDNVRRWLGLVWLLRTLMTLGTVSFMAIALWPDIWIALIASAGVQGMTVMMTSAVLAFWSDRLFPRIPSLAFTVALMAYAAGSIAGPALAGIATDAFGTQATFLGAALLPALSAVGLKRRFIRKTAISSDRPHQVQSQARARRNSDGRPPVASHHK